MSENQSKRNSILPVWQYNIDLFLTLYSVKGIIEYKYDFLGIFMQYVLLLCIVQLCLGLFKSFISLCQFCLHSLAFFCSANRWF